MKNTILTDILFGKKINNFLKCQRRIKWIAMEFIEESI